MKKLIFLSALFCVSLINSQAFSGSGDTKIQLGANLQSNAVGVNASFDYGIGTNMSVGASSSYALNDNRVVSEADFLDRYDFKARFSAHLGSIINVDDNFDVYPGVNVSLKNFGTHLGSRYFFSDGFGVYCEFNLPLSYYDKDRYNLYTHAKIHNQFSVNLGAVFNL